MFDPDNYYILSLLKDFVTLVYHCQVVCLVGPMKLISLVIHHFLIINEKGQTITSYISWTPTASAIHTILKADFAFRHDKLLVGY